MARAADAQHPTAGEDKKPSLISTLVDDLLIPAAYAVKNNPVSAPLQMVAAGVVGLCAAATAVCLAAAGVGIIVGAGGALLSATLGIGATAFGVGLPAAGSMTFLAGIMGAGAGAIATGTGMLYLDKPIESLIDKLAAARSEIDSDRDGAAKAAREANRAEGLTTRMNMQAEPAIDAQDLGTSLKSSFDSAALRGDAADFNAGTPAVTAAMVKNTHKMSL